MEQQEKSIGSEVVTVVGNAPYVKVLKDLERRRASLLLDLERIQAECAEVDSLIAGIRKLAYPSSAVLHPHLQNTSFVAATPQPGSIRSMSMRWAILTLLGKEGVTPMNVGGIVDALGESGFPITEKTRGNVSAVLSRMGGFGEVTNTGNSYAITEQGKRSLRLIIERQTSTSPQAGQGGNAEGLPEGD